MWLQKIHLYVFLQRYLHLTSLTVEYYLLAYNTMQPDITELTAQGIQLPPPSGHTASQPAKWFSSQTLLLDPPVSPCAVSAQINDIMLC